MGRWFVILIAGLCVALTTPRRAEYAQENAPVIIESELKKARRCNQEGKAAEALKLLDGIKDKIDDAHRWAYHAHRGDALFELRRPSEALVEFEASVKADVKCWVRLRQAKVLHVLGRWGEALVILDDVKPKDNEAAERDTLRLICDGPFKQRWPHAHRKLEATLGRFSVITDAGMQDAELDALNAKLAAIDTTTEKGKRDAEQLLAPYESALKIARFLDDASKRFLETLKIDAAKIPKDVTFRAFIIRGEERFRPIADVFAHDAHQFNEGEELVGLYSSSHKVLIVRDSGDKPDALTGLSPEILRTLLHEVWHQVFDAMCITRPRWLDEGLAEYFAHTEREKNAVQFGALIREHPTRADGTREVSRFSVFIKALEDGTLPSLQEFIATRDTFEQWETKDVGLNYAYGWALAYYALTGRDEPLRKAYLDCIAKLIDGGELPKVLETSLTPDVLTTSETGVRDFFKDLAKK